MPDYSYQGFDAAGQTDTGVINAGSENLAYQILVSRGITVSEISEGEKANFLPPWYKRDFNLFGHRLSFGEQAEFAEILAILFKSGLSMSEVIHVARLSSNRICVRQHMERVESRVADGEEFASAFEQENREFSSLFCSFLRISKDSNTLPELLESLALFLKRQSAIKQKIVSALIYPAILVSAAVVLFLMMILYLAPNLEPIFRSAGKTPPETLAKLLKISEFITPNWVWIVGILIAVFSFLIAAFQFPISKVYARKFALHIPIIGNLIRLSSLARISQATELLLSNGQPISAALQMAANSDGGSGEIVETFNNAATAVERGQKASKIISENRHIPAAYKEMFRIGEETNRLPLVLKALAKSMNAQVDAHSQRLLVALTPILTLVLGLGIGFLIYSLMGAILEINEIAF